MKLGSFVCFFAIMLICCNSKPQNKTGCEDIFTSCKDGLSTWTNLNIDEVFSHFPKTMCKKRYFRQISTIPLFGDNSSGIMYVEKVSTMQINLVKANGLFKDSILYYSPDVFRIRHFIFNDTATFFDSL